MTQFQVVEKEDYGTDWHPVRYEAYALKRFDNMSEAFEAAKSYLTEVNYNNSLAKEEKRSHIEAFMMITEELVNKLQIRVIPTLGCYLGEVDGRKGKEPWYLTYQKDIFAKERDQNGDKIIAHAKGETIKESSYFELHGKTEVAIREVPGTA
jgi:hypothetical protein